MDVAENKRRGEGLIEGRIGPLYVAMNHATFFLCAGLFLVSAPFVILLMRGASAPWRLTVEAGTAMETGTLLHIVVDRIYHWPARWAWGVHFATAVVLFSVMLLMLH